HTINVPLIDAGINFAKTVINDAHYFVKPSDINGISYYGSSIILGSGVVQRHYFKFNNSTAADYKFIVDGTDVVPTRYMETNYYYVDADKNAPAMKLYTPSSISVFKNSNPAEKMEFNYSVMDYVRTAKSDSTMAATALDVIRTLSWMADEAKAYFENK
uniref:hypothetical protein n=1 Tax=Ruminococcus sp. TaxID=41978 RepID=UPI0025CCD55F